MQVTLLGTGTSTGVPVIGCSCPVCISDDQKDKRLRCSCFIEVNGISILIDSGPDFRQQALEYNISRVDAVLYTHHHFDHIAGMDDLRPFLFDNREPIPCFSRSNSADAIQNMYPYIFSDGSYPGVPKLKLFPTAGAFTMTSRYDVTRRVEVKPIDVSHGSLEMFGYRIGNFGYVTDTNHIPDSSMTALKGLDVLILDALRDEPHPMHFTIDEAIEVAIRIGAKKTYFIHMTHTVMHRETQKRLPDGIELGYDGLSIELND